MQPKRKRGRPRKNPLVVPPTPRVYRDDDYLMVDLKRDAEKRRPKHEDEDSWVGVVIGFALVILVLDFIARLIY